MFHIALLIYFPYQNSEKSPPITINSKNTSEYLIKITIEALNEGMDGVLTYYLSYGEEIKTFSTIIEIGPPSSNPSSGGGINTLQVIAVVAIIGLVIFYMLNTRRKHRWR